MDVGKKLQEETENEVERGASHGHEISRGRGETQDLHCSAQEVLSNELGRERFQGADGLSGSKLAASKKEPTTTPGSQQHSQTSSGTPTGSRTQQGHTKGRASERTNERTNERTARHTDRRKGTPAAGAAAGTGTEGSVTTEASGARLAASKLEASLANMFLNEPTSPGFVRASLRPPARSFVRPFVRPTHTPRERRTNEEAVQVLLPPLLLLL